MFSFNADAFNHQQDKPGRTLSWVSSSLPAPGESVPGPSLLCFFQLKPPQMFPAVGPVFVALSLSPFAVTASSANTCVPFLLQCHGASLFQPAAG